MSTNGKTLKFRAAKLKGFTVCIQYISDFIQRPSPWTLSVNPIKLTLDYM